MVCLDIGVCKAGASSLFGPAVRNGQRNQKDKKQPLAPLFHVAFSGLALAIIFCRWFELGTGGRHANLIAKGETNP